MLDPTMKELPITEQAKENLAKAIADWIVSIAESGEAFEL